MRKRGRTTNSNVKGRFIKVICKDCGAEHVVFSRATMRVRFPECKEIQTVPKGGKCTWQNCTVVEEMR